MRKKSHSNRRKVAVPSEKNNKRNHCVYLSPETQVMKPKCSNIKRESRLLIGLAWLLKLGFLGRYQYIKNLLKKRRRRY
jgi:hypothetical protein